MENEQVINNEQQEQQPVDNAQVYIEQLNKLKGSTVSKAEYDRILAENRTLAEAITNNTYSTEEDDGEQKPVKSLNDLRKELFTPEKPLGAYDYISKAMELRQRVLEEEGEDCFASKATKNFTPSQDSLADAERTAAFYEQALEACKDDPNPDQAIVDYMQRFLVEPPRLKNNKKK